MYDAVGGDTGQTRVVDNDYSFSVSTPTQFEVTSPTVLSLFGTTVTVSSQTIQQSITGVLDVTFVVYSDCFNGVTATALISNMGVTATAGTPSSVSKNSTVIVGGAFDKLCSFTFSVPITPGSVTSTSCDISGTYILNLTVSHTGGPVTITTYPISLSSSETCATLVVNGQTVVPTLDLFHSLADARTPVGTSVGVLGSGFAVSQGDWAHWRITFPGSASSPIIQSWAISSVKWGANSTASITGASVTNGNAGLAQDSVSLDAGIAGATSYLYFKYQWDPVVFPLTASFQIPVYITINFVVTYQPTKRNALPKRETRSMVAKLINRKGVEQVTSTGNALIARVATDSSSMTLIASLSVIAGVVCLAGIVAAIFMVRRRNKKHAQTTASDSAVLHSVISV
jgi:hypothetical protein